MDIFFLSSRFKSPFLLVTMISLSSSCKETRGSINNKTKTTMDDGRVVTGEFQEKFRRDKKNDEETIGTRGVTSIDPGSLGVYVRWAHPKLP